MCHLKGPGLAGGTPAISGPELSSLLVEHDGWVIGEMGTHGVVHTKTMPTGTVKVTVISRKNRPLPEGTLGAILGPKQTGLGKGGLRRLLRKARR